jgi:hypothetical protein
LEEKEVKSVILDKSDESDKTEFAVRDAKALL